MCVNYERMLHFFSIDLPVNWFCLIMIKFRLAVMCRPFTVDNCLRRTYLWDMTICLCIFIFWLSACCLLDNSKVTRFDYFSFCVPQLIFYFLLIMTLLIIMKLHPLKHLMKKLWNFPKFHRQSEGKNYSIFDANFQRHVYTS